VDQITDEEFERLLVSFDEQSIHLETRDSYGTAIELPHLAQWEAGEPDDLEWLQDWCSALRRHAADRKVVRRARVVSEPLSDYQRWSHGIAQPMVDAGEDIRWIPRRLVSAVAIPGNDFYLFDDQVLVFLLYAGNGLGTDKLVSTKSEDIEMCRTSFALLWDLAIPHDQYEPG
jgi:hypothetical protein